MAEKQWLSYAEAAKRVKSSERTVRNWRRNGMPMSWRLGTDDQMERVVELQVLLKWWREKMQASPAHFYRMRRDAIERGETPPPVPERFKQRPRNAIHTPSQPPGVSEFPDDAEQVSDRSAEALRQVIADLPEFTGHAEHATLMRAMEKTAPACGGLEVFTHDRFADPEQTEMMRGLCRECPLLDLCEAFVIAGKPSAGMWAGMTPAEVRRLGACEPTDSAGHEVRPSERELVVSNWS